ncbi:hypothetical protein AAVH_33739, partial [Aphelenchoides avenae]
DHYRSDYLPEDDYAAQFPTVNHHRNAGSTYYDQEPHDEYYDQTKEPEEPVESHYEPNGYLPQSFHPIPESDATREYQQIYGSEFTGPPDSDEYRPEYEAIPEEEPAHVERELPEVPKRNFKELWKWAYKEACREAGIT